MTKLQFDTNYPSLDINALYGTILHSANVQAFPVKIGPMDYQYAMSTGSSYSTPFAYTTIPANGSVTLAGIPLATQSISQNGIPVYYQPPFNVKVTLQDGTVITPNLMGHCQGDACKDPAPGKIVGAYYTDWANYHYGFNSSNELMPDQIPLANMNTIFYDVGKIDRNTADISFVDINHDQFYVPAFATLKQQYPYLNLIYSFGGWGDAASNDYPSYDLAYIFDQNNPDLIQKLADNMTNTIFELGFNGIDIDYEWNAIQPAGGGMQLTPTRAKGFEELLKDIRQDLTAHQPANNPHYYKLTAAVFAGPDNVAEFVANGGDWAKVAKNVDYLDVMTYDMHGQFDVGNTPPDNITGFLSDMQTSHAYANHNFDLYGVKAGIQAYITDGVPADKLVMGIPAYTRIEKAAVPVTDANKGMYLTLAPANDQPGGETNSGGTTDYKCIINSKYCWGGFNFPSDMTYMPANLSGQGVGALEKTPWAYDKTLNWFWSFDDGRSAEYKGQWAKKHGLAGFMVWEIDGDIPKTDPNYQQYSLIYNAWKGLTG